MDRIEVLAKEVFAMRILVTGGTGFIGVPLCRELKDAGHQLVVISRNQTAAKSALGNDIEVVQCDPTVESLPVGLMESVSGVINLAGESIGGGRWTQGRKKRILGSRVLTTRALVEAIRGARKRPLIFINTSAIGYYGPHGDEELSEVNSPGNDFLAQVCVAWESEAQRAEELGIRVVLARFGLVLGPGGGALARMAVPFRFFVGGPVGNGRQWVSWVHRDDVIGMIQFAIENETISGPLNVTAPQPLTMRDFSMTLGKAIRRPSWSPVPGFILRLAFGEMADMLLNGQRVLPAKAEKEGYRFHFPAAELALEAVFKDKRSPLA